MKNFRQKLFTVRSYTPIPFLILMIIFAQPNIGTIVVGLVIVSIGESLRFWGVAYAGSLTRVTGSVGAPEVVVSGPYAHVRNPLYLGNLLTYVGIGIMSNALYPWLTLLAFLWFYFQYYEIVLLEEDFLEKEFGNFYSQYKETVPRFVPRIKSVTVVQKNKNPNWNEALHSERRTFQAISLVFGVILVLWYIH